MTPTAASALPRITSRYALRLVVAIGCGALIGAVLVLLNLDLGIFSVLMLANIGAVGLVGAYFSVQSIRRREPFRWVGYLYLAMLLAALVWAAVDM